MKILITGGAGFIGAYTAKALVATGHDVVIFDDFNDFLYPSSLKKHRVEALLGNSSIKTVTGSILDTELVKKVWLEEKPEIVIHLAAHANPARCFGNEDLYTQVNIVGTLNVLQATTGAGVKYFVMAGSSSVYNDEQTPFNEQAYPLRPRSVYGASKAAAEIYCSLWNDLYSLPMTILRFFSVYGPWGRPDMAPMIFADRLLKDQPLEVTKDERQRDFTYIDDIVAGIVAACEKRLPFEVINLGRGEPTQLRSFIGALEEAAGIKATIVDRETPPGEMKITYADTSKAKKLLGYEPRVSVKEGTAKLVQWLKENQDI